MYRYFFCFLILIITQSSLLAQPIPKVSFKTPELTAFDQHLQTPVSFFTGVPNISIPLCEVNIKDVVIPITLDYTPGIRVDQEATWVGLGWNLNHGGQIIRKQKGMADEIGFFSTNSINEFLQLPGINSDPYLTLRKSYMNEAKLNQRDFRPDEFYYSLLGFGGKFMFNQVSDKFVLYPKEDIVVNKSGDLENTNFRLTLPNGITAAYEYKTSSGNGAQYTIDSWLVSNIQNIYGDSIAFKYDRFSYNLKKAGLESISLYKATGNIFTDNYATVFFSDYRINTIYTKNQTIEFVTQNREDLPIQALSEVRMKDLNGNLVKRINFYYSYFYGDAFDLPNTVPATGQHKYKRLRLDSLSISGTEYAVRKTYKFDYYDETSLPSKFSYAQDHYGYFNGINNPRLIPNLDPKGFLGGDRRVKQEMAKVFSLKSITYPTGGEKDFFYEANTISTQYIPRGLLVQYQDDNFLNRIEEIAVSGPDRNSYYPDPDSLGEINGERFYKRIFTVPENGYPHLGLGWHSSTDIGVTGIDANLNLSPYIYNVTFYLYKFIPGEGKVLIKSQQAVNCNDNSCERTGIYEDPIDMGPGTYEMMVRILAVTGDNEAAYQPHNTTFLIRWRELDASKNMVYARGLRIKEINAYTDNGSLASKKRYLYNNPYDTYSNTSGYISSFPNYRSRVNLFHPTPGADALFGIKYYPNSAYPWETSPTVDLGYKYVTEETIGINPGDNQKTEYHFMFREPLYNDHYTGLGYGISESKEWTRGKLLGKKIYKGQKVTFEEQYIYYTYSPHLSGDTYEDFVEEINSDLISKGVFPTEIPGTFEDFYDIVESPFSSNPANSGNSDFFGVTNWYQLDNFYKEVYPIDIFGQVQVKLPYAKVFTGFDKLQTRIAKIYDDNNNILTETENYFYDSTPALNQLTRIEQINSKNQLLKKSIRYPLNFSSISPYNEMIQKNMVGNTVEELYYNGTGFLRSSKFNYKNWGSGRIMPETTEVKEGNHDTYINIQFNQYDAYGNVLELQKASDVKYSYIWDYKFALPVAEVINAAQSTIAYTSFEADNNGNWNVISSQRISTDAITGYNCYHLSNGNISKNNLSASTEYIVSYWTKNISAFSITGTQGAPLKSSTVNGWNYFIHRISGVSQVTFTGTGLIDELRIYPKDAEMITYSYKPLVGLTSRCDAKGSITYYEYDTFGRLRLIKDQNGKILKQYDYQYQKPITQ